MLETLDYTICIGSTQHGPFYISFYHTIHGSDGHLAVTSQLEVTINFLPLQRTQEKFNFALEIVRYLVV